MGTSLFFSVPKMIKIEDFERAHNKNARLDFFEILT
jgi:hypothetical protein